MSLKKRASESPSPALQTTSATDLVPENAEFAHANRDVMKNTSLLAWLDSHQLGRSLVGCSLPHTAFPGQSMTRIPPCRRRWRATQAI